MGSDTFGGLFLFQCILGLDCCFFCVLPEAEEAGELSFGCFAFNSSKIFERLTGLDHILNLCVELANLK